MGCIFVFEDGKDSRISTLLRESYLYKNYKTSAGNDKFIFVGTNSKSEMWKDIKGAWKRKAEDEEIVVFFDLPPDNLDARREYDALFGVVSGYKGITIVPIICMEYHFIHMLQFFKVPIISTKPLVNTFIKNLVGNTGKKGLKINWKGLEKDVGVEELKPGVRITDMGGSYQYRSLERAYKWILNNVDKVCVTRNGAEFFEENCSSLNCSICKGYGLQIKADFLLALLPLYEVVDAKHEKVLDDEGLVHNSVTIKEVIEERKRFFDNLCTDMGQKCIKAGFD